MKYLANLLSAVLIQIYLFMLLPLLLLLVPWAQKNNGDIQVHSKNEVDNVATIRSQGDSQLDVNNWTMTVTDAGFGLKKHQSRPLICFLPFVFFQEAIHFYYFKSTDTSHQAPQKFAPFFAHLDTVWDKRFQSFLIPVAALKTNPDMSRPKQTDVLRKKHPSEEHQEKRVLYCSITTTPQWGPSHHWEKGGGSA